MKRRPEIPQGLRVCPDDALGMNRETGRFECRVRHGRFRAMLGRGPHQALLDHMEEEAGRFFLRVGSRRIGVRT